MLLNKLNAQPRPVSASASSSKSIHQQTLAYSPSRRSLGLGLGIASLSALGLQLSPSGPAIAAGELVQYLPTKDKTPALRSGVIQAEGRYSFDIPATAKEQRIVNVLTGNFCLPNCAEPWLEAVFEDPEAGRIQLLAIPILKLTNAKNPKISELGSPENLLQRIGSYLTGSYFDEDSVVAINTKTKADGRDYYEYELNQLDATNGPHSLTHVTSKGEVLLMFVTSANDRQWSKKEGVLRQVVDSFKA